MDVSHIHKVLESFTKSHVSIPIKSNHFQEHFENEVQAQTSSVFDELDNILNEYKEVSRIKGTSNEGRKQATPKTSQINRKIEVQYTPSTQHHYIDELCFTLCCIKEPLLTLKGFDKNVVDKFKQDILAFLENTQVKVLDMAKYKYTKKGLREILMNCLSKDWVTNHNEFDWVTVRAIIVLATRYLKKGITIQLSGVVKEQLLVPASIIANDGKQTIETINYQDGKFIML